MWNISGFQQSKPPTTHSVCCGDGSTSNLYNHHHLKYPPERQCKEALKSTQPQTILPHHSQVYFPVGSPSLSHCQVDFLTIVSLNIVYLLSCHHKIRVEENVTSVSVKGYDFALSFTSQANYRLPYLIGDRSLKGIPADNTEGEIKGGQILLKTDATIWHLFTNLLI